MKSHIVLLPLLAAILITPAQTWSQTGEVTPCVEHKCIDFNDRSLHGFHGYLPCQFPSPGVTFSIAAPGPSGNASDSYMHAKDQSGASLIQNFADFNGNWLCLASNGCASFCFDFRLFVDGLNGGSLSITNSFVIVSDPDGPCGPNPPLRAQWRANFAVTEDGGTNEGWHTFCAPLELLDAAGNLPANAMGGWQMLDGAPNTDWHVLLANVTGVLFPIDFTSNPAEEVGYDNFCFTVSNCPPKCLLVSNEVIECVTNGVYTYTFAVTNLTSDPVSWIGILDAGPGVTVNGQPGGALIPVNPPLQPGQGTVLTVTITSTGVAPERLCFKMSAHIASLVECCAITHCIELPSCCAVISDECVEAVTNAPGTFQYSFTLQNLSGQPVSYIFVTPATNYMNCFTPQVITLSPPLANGATTNLSVLLNVSSNCGPTICVNISLHDVNFLECCAVRKCITLPNCCKPRTYTLDADFDEGTLVNLHHNPSDQLQLNAIAKPFPYVNVACSIRGTAVRIDVNTGQVLGEYFTAPNGMGRLPSRTTVDKFGNVWVANRNEYGESPASSGNYKGSVVRIGLIIGGTRGNKTPGGFVPNPAGAYLAPPYIYNTCVDRDSDGLIKTSSGLGDILQWSNLGGVDTHGGVSTAEDEAITVYTRVNGTGTRFIGIDCNNNVWTGGDGDQDFQMLDGFTGLPVPGFNFNLGGGGYGGLVDGYGNLWGAKSLLRFVPNQVTPPGTGALLPYWVYGLGINPLNCHVFTSSTTSGTTNYGLAEFDSAGNLVNAYPVVSSGGGLCVDGNGHVWVTQQNRIAHLAPSGPSHVLVGYITMDNASIPFSFVWGAAVDSNGKIWVTDANRDIAVRIDPALNAGIGAVDLVVPLGAGALPYNYSDMTGFVELAATCRSGFWTFIHDGCSPGNPWGKLSWNSLEPTGTSIKVEVRAADSQANLPAAPWTPVKNGASFCGGDIKGQYLEVRVSFTGAACSTESPILYDLTVDCCPVKSNCDPVNTNPTVDRCPDPITVCAADGVAVPVTVNVTVTDADGDPLTVSWSIGANPPFEIDNVPAGGPPTVGNVGFTANFPPGTHVVIMTVDDGKGGHFICDVIITVGDKEPPRLECPPGIRVIGFKGQVPEFQPTFLSDNCTPLNQIKLVQEPPPGTPVPAGNHTISLIATDLLGNSVTCQTFYAVSPNIRIVSPPKYAQFDAPASVPIEAAIDAAAGSVSRINFYEGNRLIGSADRPPYTATADIKDPGAYILWAVAVDPEGIIAASEPIQISVNGERPQAPQPTLPIPVPTSMGVQFVVPTQQGVTYVLECSDTIPATNWQVLHTIQGDGSAVVVSDTNTTRPAQFYRLRIP